MRPVRSLIEFLKHPRKLNREQAHEFWLHPDEGNKPEAYLVDERRRAWLAGFFEKRVGLNESILELGCNSGSNLEWLRRVGFKDLSGIEINPKAVSVLKQTYPQLAKEGVFYVGSLEGLLLGVEARDVVFSMTVLQHLPPESEFVFARIAEKTKRLLVTIEEEESESYSSRCFDRNYKQVFEALGLKQVEEVRNVSELPSSYVVRVFKKVV